MNGSSWGVPQKGLKVRSGPIFHESNVGRVRDTMRYSIHCRFRRMTPDIFISGWRCIISDQIFLAVESSRDTIHIYTSDDKIRWFDFVWKLTPVFCWSNHQLEANIKSVKAFPVLFFIQVLVGYRFLAFSVMRSLSCWFSSAQPAWTRHGTLPRRPAPAGGLAACGSETPLPQRLQMLQGVRFGGDAVCWSLNGGFLTWMIIINNDHLTYDPFLNWI